MTRWSGVTVFACVQSLMVCVAVAPLGAARQAPAPGGTVERIIYDGDHSSRIREQFESKVIPFFSRELTQAR